MYNMRSISHDPCVEGLSGKLPVKSMTVNGNLYAMNRGLIGSVSMSHLICRFGKGVFDDAFTFSMAIHVETLSMVGSKYLKVGM